MSKALPFFVVALATTTTFSVGCHQAVDAAKSPLTKAQPVAVDVLTATQTTMERTSTQPATVHAYFESHVFAKASGYLTELNADIGTLVQAGDVLAVLGIPEMSKQREAQLALIRQLEADERRAAAQLTVAMAGIASYQAKHEQTKAEVAKAEASLNAARVELNRVTDLVKQQAVADRLQDEAEKKHEVAAAEKTAADAAVSSAKAEMELTKAQSEAAQADLEVAKAMTDVARRKLDELDELIKYARLTAPFDGIVTQRNVDLGDLVRNSQAVSGDDRMPLFVVTKLDNVRIRVPVPERDAPLATVGDPAKITLQAIPGEVYEGSISRVAGVLDEQTRTMLVEIDLPNPEGRLRPGMFGEATITLAPPGDTVTLPANAVRFDEQGNSFVFLVNASNQVEIAQVETGLDSGEQIEVTSGLEGDEQIIGPLLRRLKVGQKVLVN